MGSIESKIKKLSPASVLRKSTGPTTEQAETRIVLTRVVFPPTKEEHNEDRMSIFLAGAIDQGAAVDWQASLIDKLFDLPITIYNPRRPHWDPSWEQSINFAPFREQVEWELGWMDKVTVITMYFPPDSKAPISLLELGIYATSGRLIVACPEKFYRRGNVEIVCLRYNVPFFETLEELEAETRRRLVLAIDAA